MSFTQEQFENYKDSLPYSSYEEYLAKSQEAPQEPRSIPKEKNTVIENTAKAFAGGAVGSAADTLRGVDWVAGKVSRLFDENAKPVGTLGEWANTIDEVRKENLTPDAQNFFYDVVGGLGSAATFIIPGLGVAGTAGKVAGTGAKLAGLGARGTKIAIAAGEVAAPTLLEAAAEGGGTVREMTQAGKSQDEIDSATAKTIAGNTLLLGGTNALGGLFHGAKSMADAGLAKQIGKTALAEGIQEGAQSVIQDVSQKKDIDLKNAGYEALVGGTVGGLLGGAGNVISNKVENSNSNKLAQEEQLAKNIEENQAIIEERGQSQSAQDAPGLAEAERVVTTTENEPGLTTGNPEAPELTPRQKLNEFSKYRDEIKANELELAGGDIAKVDLSSDQAKMDAVDRFRESRNSYGEQSLTDRISPIEEGGDRFAALINEENNTSNPSQAAPLSSPIVENAPQAAQTNTYQIDPNAQGLEKYGVTQEDSSKIPDSISEKVKNFVKGFSTNFIDKDSAAQSTINKMESEGKVTPGVAKAFEDTTSEKLRSKGKSDYQIKEFANLFNSINNNKQHTEHESGLFNAYMTTEQKLSDAIHNPEIYNISQADALKNKASLEQEMLANDRKMKYADSYTKSVFEKQAEALRTMNQEILTKAKDNGLITQKSYDEITSKPGSENYSPEMREMDKMGEQLYGPIQVAGTKEFLKQKEGSARLTLNPVKSTLNRLHGLEAMIDRNNSAIQFVDSMMPTGIVKLKSNGSDHLISLMREGKQESYYVDDVNIAKSFNAVPRPLQGPITEFILALSRVMRTAMLGTPQYLVRSIIREPMISFILGKHQGITHHPFKGMVQALGQSFGMDKATVRELEKRAFLQGGMYSSDFSPNFNDNRLFVKQSFVKQFKSSMTSFNAFMDMITAPMNKANEKIEHFLRLQQYNTTNKNLSMEERISEANRGIVELHRSGWTPLLGQIALFWRSSMLDFTKLTRAIKDRPVETLSKLIMTLTVPSLFEFFSYKDDDEWKNMSSTLKATTWSIKFGDGFIHIPKPFLLGYTFGSLPTAILDYAYNKGSTQAKTTLKQIGQELTSMALPIPSFIKPVVEMSSNHSYFTGRPIESQYQQSLIPGERSNKNTPEFIKDFGKSFNLSPAMIEYGANSYLGGAGKLVQAAIDSLYTSAKGDGGVAKPEKYFFEKPVISNFYSGENIGSKSMPVETFYSKLNDVNELHATFNLYKKQGDTVKAKELMNNHKTELINYETLNSVKRVITTLQNDIKMIEASKRFSSEEKREKIDRINRQMTKIASKAISVLK